MKKGDATIVATVILIVLTISIGLIVANFSKITEEKATKKIIKFGQTIECEDVRISIDNFDSISGNLKLHNRGTLGIDGAIIRIYKEDTIVPLYIDFNSGFKKEGASEPDEKITYKLIPDDGNPTGRDEAIIQHTIFTEPINKLELIPIIEINNEFIGCENKIITKIVSQT